MGQLSVQRSQFSAVLPTAPAPLLTRTLKSFPVLAVPALAGAELSPLPHCMAGWPHDPPVLAGLAIPVLETGVVCLATLLRGFIAAHILKESATLLQLTAACLAAALGLFGAGGVGADVDIARTACSCRGAVCLGVP